MQLEASAWSEILDQAVIGPEQRLSKELQLGVVIYHSRLTLFSLKLLVVTIIRHMNTCLRGGWSGSGEVKKVNKEVGRSTPPPVF
jgi:hypothetical protein